MSEERAPYNLGLVRDALGQSGIEEGLKLSKGLRVGSLEVPAGAGDLWLENSIRYSTALGAGATAGAISLPVSGAWTPITFTTEVWDTDEIFDLATAPTQMLIKTSGIYQTHGFIPYTASAAGYYRGISIRLNGATHLGAWFMAGIGMANLMTISATWLLTMGDYLELCAYHNNLAAVAVDTPLFSVVRIA